jgi:hypothetical protein
LALLELLPLARSVIQSRRPVPEERVGVPEQDDGRLPGRLRAGGLGLDGEGLLEDLVVGAVVLDQFDVGAFHEAAVLVDAGLAELDRVGLPDPG